MRPYSLLCIVGTIALPWCARAQHPAVQQAVQGVDADSLIWRLERLSGEVPVDIGAGQVLIASRHKSQPGNALAAQWLQQEFARMGYVPQAELFGTTGANILAEKPGVVHPERRVIIGAHYDCMPGGLTAPGADDNGSGTSAVLEAARVLAGHAFENTVVFTLWDEEEQGLVGSGYHAASAAGDDEEITAVINMDAIGYDGNGDGLLRIHARPVANSLAIKDSALMVNAAYGLDLPIAVNDPGETYSDHASFWSEGYGAILLIEDFDDDPNPQYHTPNDRLEYLDTAFWAGITRLAVGTAAVMAVPAGGNGITEALVGTVTPWTTFPNPVQEVCTLRFNAISNATQFILMDATGRSVRRWSLPASYAVGQIVQLSTAGLASGSYLLWQEDGNVSQRLLVMP